MNHDRLERVESELARLRQEHAETQRTLEAIRDALLRRLEKETAVRKKLANRISHLEHTAADTAGLVHQILNSRIWKVLQGGGGFMLNALRLGRSQKPVDGLLFTAAEKLEHIQMRCDSLPDAPKDPVAGKIEIRGWAVAPDGIAKVEIRVGSEPPIAARYGITRHDIARIFPDMRGSAKCGFVAGFDTCSLPDGIYPVSVKAVSTSGRTREIASLIVIDQEIGKMSEYHRWLEAFDAPEPEIVRVQLSGFKYCPVVSVIVPVYRTHPDILRETIDSVLKQSYPHWELCLVDDGSDMPELTAALQAAAASDSRIRVAPNSTRGGISHASNIGLAMASGEYIALLDHDDLLVEDALFYMVNELQSQPRPDLLYSDEDHIDETGRRFSPFFKPDWSPDLILGENYVCHFLVFRKDLAVGAGGFRSEFDLSQDHDILLRMSERAGRIVHIPRILYHWRTSLESMSRASNAEDAATASSRAAVANFIQDRATVEDGLHPGRWRVRYPIPPGLRVSILIPTAGKTEILDRNLKSLWKKAGYERFEIVIIDNSRGEAIVSFVENLRKQGRPIRRFDQRGQPFNYSRLNNLAAAACDSELLLFLNDDTEGISQGWLSAMVELAARPEVGAVGAKLLYPDGLIQHAGVTMGLAEICGHSFKGLPGNRRHYHDFPDLIRNVSAVTAACVMVPAAVFRRVGGFDESMFPIAYNDIDLTLKIGAAGYRVLYTPHALLYHHEAFSKSSAELHPHPAETLALKTKWKQVIARDPFYNPNLTRDRENWSLKWD